MSRLYTLGLLLGTLTSMAQVVYQEDFSDGMPSDYNLVNLDGLTPDDPDLSTMADSAWTTRFISSQGFGEGNGSEAAFSVSWYVGDEGPSDDWMILPGVQLGADPYLSWTAMAITSSGLFRDQYQVFVVTSGGTIDDYVFAAPLFDTGQIGELDSETAHTLSLSDFAGETVYVAFRNFTQPFDPGAGDGPGNGGNELAVDNITLSNGPLGLDQAILVEGLTIYSNPVTDGVLRMSFDYAQGAPLMMDILDITGRVVERLTALQAQDGHQYVDQDIHHLPAGQYLIRLSNGTDVQTARLSIQ